MSGAWDEAGGGAGNPAQAETGRRDAVRAAVTDLVRRHRELADDAERLEGYLRDYCPHQPAEVAVVVVACRSGVPNDLSRASEGIPVDAVVSRLAGRMHTESGVDQTLARWAVETWAIALGRLNRTGDAAADTPVATPVPPVAPAAPAVPAPPAASPAPPPPAPAQPGRPVGAPVQPGAGNGNAPAAAPRAPSSRLRAMVARVAPPSEPQPAPQPPPPPEVKPAAPSPPPVERALPISPAAPPPAQTRARQKTPPPAAPAPPSEPGPKSRRNWVPIAAIVGALAVVAGILVAVTRGGSESSSDDGATTIPETVPATTVAPKPFPAEGGEAPPGTYTTTVFEPGWTMTLESTWGVGRFGERPEYLQLVRNDIPDESEANISIAHLNRVFRPEAVIATGADRDREDLSMPAPADVGWITSNPRLAAGRPSPANAGGTPAVQVEVTVPSPYASDFCPVASNPRVCLPLFPFSPESRLGVGLMFRGTLYRVYQINVGDEEVLMVFAASADQYPRLLPEVDRMIASLKFEK